MWDSGFHDAYFQQWRSISRRADTRAACGGGDPELHALPLEQGLERAERAAGLDLAAAGAEGGLALSVGRQLPTPPVDAPGPFGLASEEHIAHTLTDAGFDDIVITDVREGLWLGADADDAFDYASTLGMARGLLSGLEPEQAQAALDALHKTLQAHEGPEGVRMPSAAWCTSARKR